MCCNLSKLHVGTSISRSNPQIQISKTLEKAFKRAILYDFSDCGQQMSHTTTEIQAILNPRHRRIGISDNHIKSSLESMSKPRALIPILLERTLLLAHADIPEILTIAFQPQNMGESSEAINTRHPISLTPKLAK